MKYNVEVTGRYYEEMTIEADSKEEAYEKACEAFTPTDKNCFSLDVAGLSPWDPPDEEDPHAACKYMDERAGI